MADDVDVLELLGDLDDRARTGIASLPEIVDVGDALNVEALPITAPRWHKVSDVVAVVADLKNSTQLGTNKRAASTASIYEVSTGGVVSIFDEFAADFLQIQGDGAFGLFWGPLRYERALCAAITIKTFSIALVGRLEKKWPTLPETGFKVGVASSPILAKRIGTPRNPAQQEPVWAGKAVNFAAKAAQGADRHQMVVTGSVWDVAEKNDYLAFTCHGPNGPSDTLWVETTIDRLPNGDREANGRMLISAWCEVHGAEFCSAVLAGETRRDDVAAARAALESKNMRSAIFLKARGERQARTARLRGLG